MMKGVKVIAGGEKKIPLSERELLQEGRRIAEAAISYRTKEATLCLGEQRDLAYAAGIWLLEEGYKVHADSFPPSPLLDPFRKKGGRIHEDLEGVVIDGGNLKRVSEINRSHLPVVSIDLPTGLNGTTGEVKKEAVRATDTVVLDFPKIGYFLREGWNHVGRLHLPPFDKEKEALADAIAYLPTQFELPPILRNRNKYEAGYVIGYGGSKTYQGAPKLTALAALRSGAGIVRLFCPEEIGPAAVELIIEKWGLKGWKEALLKGDALFVGPGLEKGENWLKTHLKGLKLPCVIDAGALLPKLSFPKGAILTPHKGEMVRLLGVAKKIGEEELFAKVIRFCNAHHLYIVLKGAPTFIFAPEQKPVVIPHGDPGMATAGAGDVLTGVIAALLAQKMAPYEAAMLGVYIHAKAGERGAEKKTSYSLIASDLIEYLPEAYSLNQSMNRRIPSSKGTAG